MRRQKKKRIRYLEPMIKWVKDYIEKENPLLRQTIADYSRWLKALELELQGLRIRHDIKERK